MPYESAPPFIIIIGAFCAMAGIQHLGNKMIYGKPKPMGQDEWDKKLIERDIRLHEEEKAKNSKPARKTYMGYYPDRKWFGLF